MNTLLTITGIISNTLSIFLSAIAIYHIRMWIKDKAKEALKKL
jgi:hypothetical protein